ncbi:hypothetical protein CsatA_024604 [Cannabis sativa]
MIDSLSCLNDDPLAHGFNKKQGFDDIGKNGRRRKRRRSESNVSHQKIISQQQQQQEGPFNLKSNLKKTVVNKDNQSSKLEEEEEEAKIEKRKVTWPDAHGDDIAHVQEFEPR